MSDHDEQDDQGDREMQEHTIAAFCSECKTLVEVVNPQALILALHLQSDCTISPLLRPQEA